MANTYNWQVTQMSCYPTYESQTDVVFSVAWGCSGTNGTYNAYQSGNVTVTYVAGDPYTPYADLTEVQVQGWVWSNGVDQATTEASLATNIANQVNPPVVTPPLPWSV